MRKNKVAKRYRTAKDREAAMADFLIAYEKSLGVLKPACDMTGMCRKTIWEWRKKYPEFDAACHDCEETAVDFVETKLYKLINDGAEASTIFYLKTKGRKRGYVEKHEVDMSAEVKGVTVNVTNQETAQVL
ncbi:MAG: hypothetical protein II207_06590, partial [Clostridia bacterium]|nr:hypothetical protein [Clostridia bacterium]